MNWQKRFFEKVNKMNSLKQERGSILVLTVILLPIMFAFLGFAFDFGNIYMHKARLQNVADAAALAGARAYLNSQTNEDPNDRDSVDGIVDRTGGKLAANSSATYKEGRSTPDVYNVRDTQKTKNRDYSKHIAADRAADEYIYRNIVNLGSEVKSDRWSHYAINSDNTDPKTFYRVGLYEEVPLYFLPIIQSIGKTQTVRAGAIAVVEKGTGDSGGGGGGTITHTSVFDNLFTFSESLFTKNNIYSDGTIITSFQGDMVYTHQNGLMDGDLGNNIYYESSTPGPAGDDNAISTNQNHWYESKGGKGSSSTTKINDPIIDTSFDTRAYLSAFQNKILSYPHKDLTTDTLYLSENAAAEAGVRSCVYYKQETIGPDTGTTFYYYPKDNNYFRRVSATGSFATVSQGGEVYNICYYRIPINQYQLTDYYVLCGKKEGDYRYYLLETTAKNTYTVSNKYIGGKLTVIDHGTWQEPKYELDKNIEINEIVNSSSYTCYHDSWNTPVGFIQTTKDAPSTNIYHVNRKLINNQTIDIYINSSIQGDDVNEPVYIIIDDVPQVHIYGTAETTRRPVIIVCLGESITQIKYEFQGGEFRGVIYAPISGFEHIQNLTGVFRGNIITKKINIEANSGMSFIQENFLENSSYTDADIKAVSDAHKQQIEAANAKLTDDIKKLIRDRLGITEAQQNDLNWFNSLRYPEKQSLFVKWKALYEEYKNNPAIRNVLWPWNEHFNIDVGEVVTSGDKLRLINFRTDYLDSNQENAVVDPFIFLSLEKPDAY